MRKIILPNTNTIDKDDCINFEWQKIDWCCGRQKKIGACKLGSGALNSCNIAMPYCRYQKYGRENVHTKKLPNTNLRNRSS